MKSYILLFVLLITTVALKAQTGPGGIGNTDGSNGEPKVVIWLDADEMSSTYVDGDAVSLWTDKSGNGNDLTESDATCQPTFKTAQINGYPAIYFNPGSGEYEKLVLNPFYDMPQDEITVFVVYKTTDSGEGVVSYASSASDNDFLLFNSSDLKLYRGSSTEDNVSFNGGDWEIMLGAWQSSGGNAKIYKVKDNVSTTSSYYSTSGFKTGTSITTGGAFVLGSEQDAVDGGYDSGQTFSGYIAEVIVYEGYLSDAEIRVVANYLNAKYGDADLAIYKDGFSPSDATYVQDMVGVGKEDDGDMSDNGNGGLYLRTDASWSNGDYMFGAHNGAVNDEANIDRSTDVTNATSAEAAWNRMYYIEKLGSQDANVIFDLQEAFTDGKYFASETDYVLLYRSNTTGNYSEVSATKALDGATKIVFTVADADWNDGYFTLGTKDETNSPLIGKYGLHFYAYYKDGDWSDKDVWALDKNGNTRASYAPSASPTSAIDEITILGTKRVTVTSDNLHNVSLDVDGTLLLGTTTGHSFDEIKGEGTIYLETDNFPSGDATRFVTKDLDGGTVIFQGSGFDMNTAHEFCNVQIDLNNSTDEIVLLNDLTINGKLTINSGTLKINNNTVTTDLNIKVTDELLVEPNGNILTGSADARHQLNLYGDFTNKGTCKFTNRTTADYSNEATDGIVDVNFLNNQADQGVTLNGTTVFYRIEIDKGSDNTYIVDFSASDPSYFKLYGYAAESHGSVAQLSANNNALGLVKGTVKLGSNIEIPLLNTSGNYNISEAARLWVAGATVKKNSGTALVPYGIIQVSAGTLEAKVNSGITTRANGLLKVEGGTVNINIFRTSVLGSSNVGGYIQSGGTVNIVNVANSTSDYYHFCLTYEGNVFNMSGGTLHVFDAKSGNTNEGGIFIASSDANINVTGGTVIAEISANTNPFKITSTAPFYNLILRNTYDATTDHILSEGVDVSSTNEYLAAQPLVVLKDLTIEDNCFLDHNGQDITIGGDFNIAENSQQQGTNNYGLLYDSSKPNTITFNGSGSDTLYISHNVNDGYEMYVYNMTVDKEGEIVLKGDLAKDPDNVTKEWYNRLLNVKGDNLYVKRGVLNQGRQSIRLYALVNISTGAQLGVFEYGTTDPTAYIMLKDDGAGDTDITTEEGAIIGNLKLNPGDGKTVSISSDVYIKRIGIHNGRLNIGTHKLKVDYIHWKANLQNFDIYSDSADIATDRMILTDANASDGGIMLYIPKGTVAGTEFGFPLGTETNSSRYTPVQLTIDAQTTDSGYVQIRPVDGELKTTKLSSSDDILSYYWRIGYEGFTTQEPTVEYEFNYDNSDLDGSPNEATFVPGKVLDDDPYTRSYENDVTKVDDSNNRITFNGSGSGFDLEEANYTAGGSDRFTGTVDKYYSYYDKEGGTGNGWYNNWDDADTWDKGNVGSGTHEVPTEGSIVFIMDRARVWGNSIPNVPAEVNFIFNNTEYSEPDQENVPRLQFNRSGTFDIGKVSGAGMISSDNSDTRTINADWGEFATNDSSFIMYYNGSTTHTNIIQPCPSLMLEGSTQKIDQDITINANLILTGGTTCVPLQNIHVKKNLYVGAWSGGTFQFPGTGSSVTITVDGNIDYTYIKSGTTGQTRTINIDNSGNNIEHKIILKGDIIQGDDNGYSLDLFSVLGETNVILELQGVDTNNYYRTSTSIPDLYRIVMNKGVDQTSYFTFDDDFTLHGATSGAGIAKSLELQNGTLVLDDSDISFALTTGNDDFYIPSTSALVIKQGSLTANGNSSITLDGKLSIEGGSLDMSGVGQDNHIEYSASGNAELIITGGSLTVASQIRGSLTADLGILKYTQTGGTVIVGNNSAPDADRGVFEVHNTGSAFTFTGGTLEIVRAQTSATKPALRLLPSNSTIGSNMTIKIGNASTPASQNFGIRSSVTIPNLTIDNTSGNNPTATIQTESLTVDNDVTVQSGAILDANGWDLYIGGDFYNAGTYTAGTNTTYINGAYDQNITGGGTFTFNNLTKSSSSILDINQDITINGNLQIDAGIINDNSNTITLKGNLTNNGALSYGGSGDGLLMNGSLLQRIYGDGTIGKLTIDNSNNVEVYTGYDVTINNELKLNTGIFDISENLLTINNGATITTDNIFGPSAMIQTTKSYVDAGVKKYFASRVEDGDSTTFLMPIGSNGLYTPVTFYIKANDNSTGSITIKASHETHPTIIEDDEAPDDYEIEDVKNALHYYWVLTADGITGFKARVNFQAHDSMVYVKNANGSSYTQADYITARLLKDGSYNWDKFDQSTFDETNDILSFQFTGTNDAGITGDYTAGIEPSTSTKLGAIPDQVALYTSTKDGDWTDVTVWTPTPPAGGPRGSRVKIDNYITMDDNFTSSYTVEISATGTLDMKSTYGHRLGDLTGNGTLRMESSSFPSAYYEDFVSASGGELEFSGSTDYTVLGALVSVNSVKFTGTGTRSLPNNDVVFLGDFTIDGTDATLIVDNTYDNTYTLKGDFVYNTGAFDAGTGSTATIIMNGTSTQTIAGNLTATNSSSFYNLEIDNSAGVTIDNDIEIEKYLYLTNGLLTPATTGTITITNTDEDAVQASSSSSYVNGKLYKVLLNSGNFEFPIGNTSQYKRIKITNARPATSGWTSQIWRAEYLGNNSNTSIKSGDELTDVSTRDLWTMGCPSDALGKVTLYWDASSNINDNTDLKDLRVAKLTSSEWHSTGNTDRSGNQTEGTVSSEDSIHFSYQTFTIGTSSGSVLPVELLFFTGKDVGDAIELAWATETETNNDYFEVQRSNDAEHFTTIGLIYGAGNSMSRIDYSYIDENPQPGMNYYRLKQVDYNGDTEYHKTIAVKYTTQFNSDSNKDFVVYPNPYSYGELVMDLSNYDANTSVTVLITDMSGKLIVNKAFTVSGNQQVDMVSLMNSSIEQGIYFITVIADTGVVTKRLIVE